MTAIASAKTRNVRRVPTSGISTSAETSVPTRLPAVESAYRRPATVPASSTFDTASRIAHGDTAPSSSTGTATSTEHRQQRADERAGGDLVECVDRHVEQRVGRERHEREQAGREQAEQAEAAHVRVAVREAPAQPVADRERDQHDADGVGPHDRGGAEVRSEQPDRRDLGAQRSRSDHEDEQRAGAAFRPEG